MRFLTLALLVLYATGCAHQKPLTPLQQYLADFKYTAFDAPREGDAVLTIVNFSGGTEDIVADSSECFQGVATSDVPLELPSYDVTTDNDLELKAAAAFKPGINLRAAFSDHRISRIRIELLSPFYRRATDLAVEARLGQIGNQAASECAARLASKPNYLIKMAVGVHGLRYAFLTAEGEQVALDADLARRIKLLDVAASTTQRSNTTQATSLQFDGTAFLGYRLWKPAARAALDTLSFELHDVTPEQVRLLKTPLGQNR